MVTFRLGVLAGVVTVLMPDNAHSFSCKHVIISQDTGYSMRGSSYSSTRLNEMKRPILDQIATVLFKLENDRVEKSSEVDEKGRIGEPMAWSESDSLANKFSEVMAGPGYAFKQFVADIVAGEYDQEETEIYVNGFVASNDVAMFSFSTCPFCRRAKDFLDESGISYTAIELDELPENRGNEIRAQLGRLTRRTSVPSIFVRGQFIGGCNDGPGLLPLAESGELKAMLQAKA
mmetsp:Transcript_8546/g.12637  ORF Transcript_8546/g.12637 Transcript_8546/m.12637 type:complete len:232 (+) Transcript_8546:91-786(+)